MLRPTKHALRNQLREALRAKGAADLPQLRAQIMAWLREHPQCRVIAAFAALPGEPDLLPLIEALPELSWVLPRVAGDDLIFHHIRKPEIDLVHGAFNIREPRLTTPVIDIQNIDVFLCPGLGFDRHGGRLGRGRGFYDRMLENARPNSVKIGVCHSFQRVDDVFAEPHDIAMDLVFSGEVDG